MSVQAISWVLEHSESTGSARCVLVAIANHVGHDGVGWAYVEQVCREANCSIDTYHRAITWAVEAGELERLTNAGAARRAAANRKPNEYALLKMGSASCPPQDEQGSADCLPLEPLGSASCPLQDAHPEPSLVLEPLEKQEPSTRASSAGFDAFWSAYPRRQAKAAAEKAWAKAVKVAHPAVIVAGARAYASDPNREAEFTAHAATWLNAGRWDDEPLPARGGSQRPSAVTGRADRSHDALRRFLGDGPIDVPAREAIG